MAGALRPTKQPRRTTTPPGWRVRLGQYLRDGQLLYYQIDVTGPRAYRKRISLGTSDRAKAERLLADWIAARLPAMVAERDRPESPAGPTLREVADWYLETHIVYLGRAEKTQKHYRRVIEDFITFASQRHVGRVQQVSWRLIEEWQLWLSQFRKSGDSRISRRDELLALRRWFESAADADVIPERLEIRWKIPAKESDTRFRALTADELREFLAMIRARAPHIGDVVEWLAITGWRIDDVLTLEWAHVSGGAIDHTQGKTKRPLPYPVTAAMREILDRQPEPHTGAVFRHDGKPWRYDTVKKAMEYACRRYFTRNVSPRDLRRTFGTRLAMSGCPPNVLQHLMGHASVEVTLMYYVDVGMPDMALWAEKFAGDFGRILADDP